MKACGQSLHHKSRVVQDTCPCPLPALSFCLWSSLYLIHAAGTPLKVTPLLFRTLPYLDSPEASLRLCTEVPPKKQWRDSRRSFSQQPQMGRAPCFRVGTEWCLCLDVSWSCQGRGHSRARSQPTGVSLTCGPVLSQRFPPLSSFALDTSSHPRGYNCP